MKCTVLYMYVQYVLCMHINHFADKRWHEHIFYDLNKVSFNKKLFRIQNYFKKVRWNNNREEPYSQADKNKTKRHATEYLLFKFLKFL